MISSGDNDTGYQAAGSDAKWELETSSGGAHTHPLTGSTGDGRGDLLKTSSDAHENRPPYYALAFIMKL